MSAILEAIELLHQTNKRQDEEIEQLRKENVKLNHELREVVRVLDKFVDRYIKDRV